jgi:UDP-N-acetylmuramoyl-L-alanyl-D-glutamate--2,6-diaminopimelate ligase
MTQGLELDQLARELPGKVEVIGDGSVRVRGVRHDSRAVAPGELFVARRGQKVDGAAFANEAVKRGAVAVLAARGALDPRVMTVPLVLVDDAPLALAFAASAVYGHPSFSLDVVGITGTNGKTTTAHLARIAIDGAIGRAACGVIGTLGSAFRDDAEAAAHTTPEADDIARALATMRQQGATHVAMEVSSHALALGRVRAVQFRVAGFTNLTQDHLDFHGSMETYAETKARLFTELGPGCAVLNVDDAYGRRLSQSTNGPRVRVTASPNLPEANAEIAPRHARLSDLGVEATVRTPSGDVALQSRLVGGHNFENLLLALGIVQALELDVHRAAEALSQAAAPPGRLERCDSQSDGLLVLVDYAHTPDALRRVLEAVRAVASGRVWCVFGCGGDRDPTKREPMGRAVAQGADVVVITNDNPRTEDARAIADTAARGVRAEGKEPIVELDRRAAITRAVLSAAPGDAILIAGKGHETYQIIGVDAQPFDDRLEARRALGVRRRTEGSA